MEKRETDLLIIGAGPGGYVSAIFAAKQGLGVTLVDKSRIGGTCLNVGCIPTKALVKSSELYQELLHLENIGLSVENPSLDLPKIIEHKNEVKNKLVSGIEYLLQKYNVNIVQGTASFLDDSTVKVDGEEPLAIVAKDIIIATGSKTKHLPIPGIDSKFVIDSSKLLDNTILPKHLAIIGGGIIGMEFAFIYASLGVPVTVIEFLPRILPGVDKEFPARLMRYAKQLNMNILTNSKVTKIEEQGDQAIVSFERKGKEESIACDMILEAIGRGPNLDNLGLENTSLVFDTRGGIPVDSHLKTNVEHIYAIGDVTNLWQLAHVASHQGIVAVENILGHDKEMDYSAVPAVIFTSPQIATVGLSEEQCLEKEISYEVIKVPYSANGKALIMQAEAGYIKLLANPENKQLIGGMIFGKEAEHLIATITVAIQNKLTAKQLQETIFAHPTMSELIHEGALGLDHLAIHFVD
ncbi:MAG: dihydrolipoyl dehydrogenase [Bacilli bacterium]|nr:dihydrolipoyl dehydrogenase [Bacilli bacterium]MBN2877218.1 dihydrolipoyl dehydrogenase [Bacilli bacterium]